jgi:hypothetical protein
MDYGRRATHRKPLSFERSEFRALLGRTRQPESLA